MHEAAVGSAANDGTMLGKKDANLPGHQPAIIPCAPAVVNFVAFKNSLNYITENEELVAQMTLFLLLVLILNFLNNVFF